MDLTVRTYDPKQVIITFGTTVLTGFAEGTFVSIERSSDAFEKSRGADGSIDRVNKNVFDFAVNITLKQTSPVNGILAGILAADQISNKGVLPLTIKDLGGITLFTAAQAWIRKDPTAELGDSLGSREWGFDTGPALLVPGGNN